MVSHILFFCVGIWSFFQGNVFLGFLNCILNALFFSIGVKRLKETFKTKEMKKYTLTDNKTGKKYHYSFLVWNFAWFIVFAMGIIVGYCI